MSLTQRQITILQAVYVYQKHHSGASPSYADIVGLTSYKSYRGIGVALEALAKAGLIEHEPYARRCSVVTPAGEAYLSKWVL